MPTTSSFRSGRETPAASPRGREDRAAQLQKFHAGQVQQHGESALLRIYSHALRNWILNPNTDPYQIEMLYDEICHVSQDGAAAPNDL